MRRALLLVLVAYGGCGSTESRTNRLSFNHPLPAVPVLPTIGSIPAPEGFVRINSGAGSFGHWLRNIELKKNNTVYLYNGKPKPNQHAQYAVTNIPVGKKDLQQCADAVIRLRAEYLFNQKRFSEIVFSDNSGRLYRWKGGADRSYFPQYLERVFGMCGTASLEKQLKPASLKNMKPGDVLIKGGFPGHAMIVADVAKNKNGNTVYMLAQSYMPAQDIHIVKNPAIPGSPWFEVNAAAEIVTPEWVFLSTQLRSW
ncbi:DUF4846 domain-containing protein [Niabella aquatica]